MSPQGIRSSNASLLDVADRLADDFADVAAGSVRRCFARAVVIAHVSGVPAECLPTAAEELARRMLTYRIDGRSPEDPP